MTNRKLIEYLNTPSENRKELTQKEYEERMKGVTVYKPIPYVVDYEKWLTKNKLNLDELLSLSLGESPDDPDLDSFFHIGLINNEKYQNRRDEVENWIRGGELEAIRVDKDGSIEYENIDPKRFLELAIERRWDLPQEITDFIGKNKGKGTFLNRYLIDPSLGLDANLDHYTIIDLWRYDENGTLLIDADCYGDTGLEKILIKAVRDGELIAIVHKREQRWEKAKGNGTGFIKVDKSDYNDIRNEGYFGGAYVRLTIHRDDFKSWLKKTNQCLPDGCLLNLWFKDDESQTEAVENLEGAATIIVKTPTPRTRGKTQITTFLEQLCQEQDIDRLCGESLVSAIKIFVDTKNSIEKQNCPVKKHHGWHKEVSVEWKPGTGSKKGSWGSKSFSNFVSEYKKNNVKNLSSINFN